MKQQAGIFRTTHTGSLPRPPVLSALEDAEQVQAAVEELVRRQIEAGIDIVNDGEASKPSYATYVTGRLSGFGDERPMLPRLARGIDEFPEFFANRLPRSVIATTPACEGPVTYLGTEPVEADIPGVWNNNADITMEQFRAEVAMRLAAIDHAIRDIPGEAVRLHICWGNYQGPHNHDVPLAAFLDLALNAKPHGISFEAANPRHEHEWAVFADVKLPDGKVLFPGVVDSTSSFIEHPELIAQRILRFADVVGAENVIASTDCGFATVAGHDLVDPEIAWAKLAAMSGGAAIAARTATERLAG